jgi:DNA-binding transcriptional ArsR family regulator
MKEGDREQELDPVWKALANPIRRRMLDVLRDGPCTTGELAARFPDLSRFAVMQHLGALGRGGLVVAQRDGRRRFNYFNPVPIQQIFHRWVNRYQRGWMESLVTLKTELEQEDAAPRRAGSRRKRA